MFRILLHSLIFTKAYFMGYSVLYILYSIVYVLYRMSIKSLYNLKKLLQREMMRYRNEGCFMLISIS